VVLNPYKAIRKHFQDKKSGLDEASFNSLIQRMNDIGAKDFDAPKPPVAASEKTKLPESVSLKPTPNLPPPRKTCFIAKGLKSRKHF
jgi:hypothetical protein